MLKLIEILIGIVAGFLITHLLLRGKNVFDFEKKTEEAKKLISKAKNEAETILGDTKKQTEELSKRLKEYEQKREERIKKLEQNLQTKEDLLIKKENKNNETKLKLASEEEEIQALRQKCKILEKDSLEKLFKITGEKPEELKEKIIEKYRHEIQKDSDRKLSNYEEDIKENALRTAQKITLNIQQRLSLPTTTENKSVYLDVPKDHIKGKIVGREGRNIQEFEKLLDVDVVFNELPNTISISCFNLVRRRKAQRAMEKLINHRGEIDFDVINQVVEDAEKEIDQELYRLGKKALTALNLPEKDVELTKIIGRLKFRTSYGQNILKHSLEVAWIAMMIGYELGLDVEVLRSGAFLHDLGKAIDHEPGVEGTHDVLSKQLMEKYGYSWEEVHAAWTHHDAEPQQTPEAIIVKAADAISASRPGARRESMEKYIERLQALEKTARSFEGVSNTYAISAGRELRILVDPQIIKDEKTLELAEKVADKIEEDVTYPGKIKVNVIRKTVSTETVK